MSAFPIFRASLWLYFCIMLRSMEALSPSARPDPGKTQLPLYSAVVVFGDSYSDDGHRQTEPMPNPYKAMPGKHQAVVWPEFLVEKMSSKNRPSLYDYAYNGAHANSDLTHYGNLRIPDMRQQIKEFASQLEKGEISLGTDRTLTVCWIGTNPVDVIWLEAFGSHPNGGNGTQASGSPPMLTALGRVEKQIIEVEAQLHHVRSDLLSMKKTPNDFMMITVPHMNLVPALKDLAKTWSNGDLKLMDDYLKHLVFLIDHYNEGLRGVVQREQYNQLREGKSGVVQICDIVTVWDQVLKEGSHYGLTDTTGQCLKNNVVCPNPDQFAFWDGVHPGPKVEQILADTIYDCLLNIGK